jgi:hypothetical protein
LALDDVPVMLAYILDIASLESLNIEGDTLEAICPKLYLVA